MSKTRVNLYTPSLLPAQLRLPFARVAQLAVLLLLLLALLWAAAYWQAQQQRAQLQTLNQQNGVLEQQKNQLQNELARHLPDAKLQADVDLLQQEQQLKTLLLNELGQREQLKSAGFTQMLQDLAQSSDGSIWLSRIRFDENRLTFEGFAKAPESVPAWVARLGASSSFRGKAFAAMTMNRDQQQPLSFRLTTESTEASKP